MGENPASNRAPQVNISNNRLQIVAFTHQDGNCFLAFSGSENLETRLFEKLDQFSL